MTAAERQRRHRAGLEIDRAKARAKREAARQARREALLALGIREIPTDGLKTLDEPKTPSASAS